MLQRFINAPWWQLSDYLQRGNPPLIAQLTAINTIFFLLFIARRMRGVPGMRKETMIQVQGLVILSNVLLLFQDQIIWALRQVTT